MWARRCVVFEMILWGFRAGPSQPHSTIKRLARTSLSFFEQFLLPAILFSYPIQMHTHTPHPYQVEFSKGEGITYSEELKKVYIALTRFKIGALDGATTTPPYRYDIPGHDDVRLPDNSCGGILELDVANGWRPVHARMMIAGTPQAADAQGNTCDVNGIASPDNVLVLPGTR